MARILIVEDEPTLLSTLKFNLERQSYEVLTAPDGEAAFALVDESKPDLLILDLMLPGMPGIELCRAVRKKSQIPIVILTAKTDEVDRIVGLELGADDYVTKPFSMAELMARVRALLRRSQEFNPREPAQVLATGPLRVNLASREVWMDDRPLDLKPKEFELLVMLMQHPGQTLTREQLLARVWKYEGFGSTRTVDVHIGRLRSQIEEDAANPVRIITVRGIGYRLNG